MRSIPYICHICVTVTMRSVGEDTTGAQGREKDVAKRRRLLRSSPPASPS